ncbi:hypothetical protein D3C78_1790680 [compost metagenome]
MGLWLKRLFLDGNGALVVVEFHDAEALRVFHLIAEDSGALLALGSLAQHGTEALSVEDVVA